LLLLLLLLLLVILLFAVALRFSGAPIRSDGASGQNPAGATCMDARRFLPRHGCRVRKFPLAEWTRSAAEGARDWGVLSLGYVSLHEQRKVTRSEGAKAFDVAVAFASTKNQQHHK
jgi:hypothetical protein